MTDYVTELEERLAALEWALESTDWRMLTMQAEQEFSREGLRAITELCRVMYLKNPIVQRGVDVKKLYVFGQGFNVQAANDQIDDVLTAFYDDPKNQAELSHQALTQKEIELQTDGNLFFVFFVNKNTGRVRVRSIPFDEILERINDPDDAKTPWYYLRTWTETKVDQSTGAIQTETRRAYYPDWRYTPVNKPNGIGQTPVVWDQPVMHVKVGGFSNWQFGISEIYDAIDWAKAYKEFLEDWATIVRAYRRFAFQLTTPGGKAGIAAAKAKLGTTLTPSSGETNPPPVAGSTFISGEGVSLQPVRTSGATVSAEDGRRILLMVAAAFGLPETFFGDSSVGTLATAKSLDRPTELMMLERQRLWTDILQSIHDYVLLWAVKAGPLKGLATVKSETDDGIVSETIIWPETNPDGSEFDSHVALEWPPLIEHDIAAQIAAITQAATLNGQALAGTIDLPTLSRMLLTALGVPEVDEIVGKLFPDGEVPEEETPDVPDEPAPADPLADPLAASEAALLEAVKELRNVLGERID